MIVIAGYNHAACWETLLYAFLFDVPVVPWSGTWSGSLGTENRLINTLREIYTKRGSSWIAYGSRASEALRAWGAEPESIHVAINTVDVKKYAEYSSNINGFEPNSASFEILYCGQLIPRKNVQSLFNAVSMIESENIQVNIVGDGPLLAELREYTADLKAEINFEGHISRQEIIPYYTKADLVVLPSSVEVWGLVVNEALACGTPVIVSDMCGCAPDVVREGFNGHIFDHKSPQELSHLISKQMTGELKYASAKDIQQDAIHRLSIQRSFDGFIEAIYDANNS
ncbi:glycosyltransferase family 4 protein [Haloplanus rallus]|uniref:glycosyltransferase family 4 protein n=1 Tax=Haloplanus rallus TaxID=1816183 RepID=UPI0012FDF707|nr:glycosyltransferase family 4 protein [Haloplanus rallus]